MRKRGLASYLGMQQEETYAILQDIINNWKKYSALLAILINKPWEQQQSLPEGEGFLERHEGVLQMTELLVSSSSTTPMLTRFELDEPVVET